MAFWKLKFFKNGSALKNGGDFKDDIEHDFKRHESPKSKDDSPKSSSTSSLEDYPAPIPRTLDPEKRQMVPHRELENGHRFQSMTMEEAQREKHVSQPNEPRFTNGLPKVNEKPVSYKWLMTENELRRAEAGIKPPPSPEMDVVVPAWRREPERKNKSSPPLKLSPKSNGEVHRCSPTWNAAADQKIQRQFDVEVTNYRPAKPPENAHEKKEKRGSFISTVSVPQQSAPCFVFNNPCPYTGSYPCYVMSVFQHTPYVPVQIYPMMLVPNPPTNKTVANGQRMVY